MGEKGAGRTGYAYSYNYEGRREWAGQVGGGDCTESLVLQVV